ncbi:MAG: MerR family transcriptional regulator [Moraxella sp.]
MKIGELAKRTGATVETIRYYEKERLLPEPFRSEGNYRLYNEEHIERLQFILHCRTLDMALDDVRILLEYWESPAHSQRARFNHMFLATYAVFKLECLKIKTKLNHFALRLKLLVSANQSAFAQLKAISGA